jgi:uncharacterized membrane protein
MPRGIWLVLEIAGFCGLVAIWAIALASYGSLPERIPTHFGLSGEPDGYGGKGFLLVLVGVQTLLYGLLSVVPCFPDRIQVLGERTPGKIRAAIGMVRVLKVEMMVFFAFLTSSTVEAARGLSSGLGLGPLLFVGLILITTAVGLYACSRNEE